MSGVSRCVRSVDFLMFLLRTCDSSTRPVRSPRVVTGRVFFVGNVPGTDPRRAGRICWGKGSCYRVC
jgi:hypothetical protein